MKLYIPELKDRIVLTKDWAFDLYNEERNITLMEALGIKPTYRSDYRSYLDRHAAPHPALLPAGTELQFDRIYIRKGAEEYSSISFYVTKAPPSIPALDPNTKREVEVYDYIERKLNKVMKKGKKRFWAKLADVNNVEFEPVA